MKIVVPHCIDAEAAAAVDNKWVARCGSFSAAARSGANRPRARPHRELGNYVRLPKS